MVMFLPPLMMVDDLDFHGAACAAAFASCSMPPMAVAIDTYAAIQELEAAGIKPEHAAAIVKTVS